MMSIRSARNNSIIFTPATTLLAGGVSTSVLVIAAAAAAAVSKLVIAPVLRKILAQPERYDRILVSIPYSHFVESARWAIERRGLRLREIKIPIGPHSAVVAFYRLLFHRGLSCQSSYVGQDFSDSWIPTVTNTTLRRLSAVPLVISTQSYHCLPDSWGVLEDCNFKVCDSVRERWDQDFGPSVRQVGYYYIFQQKNIYRDVQSCNRFWMFFHDVMERTMQITWFMKRMMFMTPQDVAEAEQRILNEFERISKILETFDYLGDGTGSSTLGGADIAFAALSGWLILPENFHNGHVKIPEKTMLPDNMKKLMDCVGTTLAAKHVRRCYEQRGAVLTE